MFEPKVLKLEPNTRAAVLRMLKARHDPRSLPAIVDEALQAWLARAACEDPPAAQEAARGYLWKSLFLPEGTLVRFDYRRQTYNAEVRGDRLMFMGKAYSPRALLLHVTGTVRNAWRELWIRCPDDFRWHLADTRRYILRRTPRGLHTRGVDAASFHARYIASLRLPPADTAGTVQQDGSANGADEPVTPAAAVTGPFDWAGVTQAGLEQDCPGLARPHEADICETRASQACNVGPQQNEARNGGSSAHNGGNPAIPAPSVADSAPLSAERRAMALRVPPWVNGLRAGRLSSFLYRDDLVRKDQPDLTWNRGGGWHAGAGRAGPRDRRHCNLIYPLRPSRAGPPAGS